MGGCLIVVTHKVCVDQPWLNNDTVLTLTFVTVSSSWTRPWHSSLCTIRCLSLRPRLWMWLNLPGIPVSFLHTVSNQNWNSQGHRKEFWSGQAVIGVRVWHAICNGTHANIYNDFITLPKKLSSQNRTSRTSSYAYDGGKGLQTRQIITNCKEAGSYITEVWWPLNPEMDSDKKVKLTFKPNPLAFPFQNSFHKAVL